MMLWSVHTEDTRLISCEIIFALLQDYYKMFYDDNSTSVSSNCQLS